MIRPLSLFFLSISVVPANYTGPGNITVPGNMSQVNLTGPGNFPNISGLAGLDLTQLGGLGEVMGRFLDGSNGNMLDMTFEDIFRSLLPPSLPCKYNYIR